MFSFVVIKIKWLGITCGCADTHLNQNQNHWQLIPLLLYHVWERNRLSDLSSFWKCNIPSFFPLHSEKWSPLRLQAQRKGCAFVSCQWKRLPTLPAWVMPHRLYRQTDRQDDLTDRLVYFLTNSFCQNKLNLLYCCINCTHIHLYVICLAAVVQLWARKEKRRVFYAQWSRNKPKMMTWSVLL